MTVVCQDKLRQESRAFVSAQDGSLEAFPYNPLLPLQRSFLFTIFLYRPAMFKAV